MGPSSVERFFYIWEDPIRASFVGSFFKTHFVLSWYLSQGQVFCPWLLQMHKPHQSMRDKACYHFFLGHHGIICKVREMPHNNKLVRMGTLSSHLLVEEQQGNLKGLCKQLFCSSFDPAQTIWTTSDGMSIYSLSFFSSVHPIGM